MVIHLKRKYHVKCKTLFFNLCAFLIMNRPQALASIPSLQCLIFFYNYSPSFCNHLIYYHCLYLLKPFGKFCFFCVIPTNKRNLYLSFFYYWWPIKILLSSIITPLPLRIAGQKSLFKTSDFLSTTILPILVADLILLTLNIFVSLKTLLLTFNGQNFNVLSNILVHISNYLKKRNIWLFILMSYNKFSISLN